MIPAAVPFKPWTATCEIVFLIGGPFDGAKQAVAHLDGHAWFREPGGLVHYSLDGSRRGGLRVMAHRRAPMTSGDALHRGLVDVATAAG